MANQILHEPVLFSSPLTAPLPFTQSHQAQGHSACYSCTPESRLPRSWCTCFLLMLCFGLIATYSESPLICLDKLTQTPYSFSLRLPCIICFLVTYQALERSKLFVFMFIVHLSILLGKFQQSRDLGLCANESPHPAQGLEKASKDTSLMGK